MSCEDKVDDETVTVMREILKEVRRREQVRGKWHIRKSTKGIIWCKAVSLWVLV